MDIVLSIDVYLKDRVIKRAVIMILISVAFIIQVGIFIRSTETIQSHREQRKVWQVLVCYVLSVCWYRSKTWQYNYCLSSDQASDVK